MGILSSLTRTLGGGGRRSSRPTIGAHIGRSPGFGRQARSQRRRSSGLGGALLGTLGGLALRELSRRGAGGTTRGRRPGAYRGGFGPSARSTGGLGTGLLGGQLGGALASRGRSGAAGRRTAGGRRTVGGGF